MPKHKELITAICLLWPSICATLLLTCQNAPKSIPFESAYQANGFSLDSLVGIPITIIGTVNVPTLPEISNMSTFRPQWEKTDKTQIGIMPQGFRTPWLWYTDMMSIRNFERISFDRSMYLRNLGNSFLIDYPPYRPILTVEYQNVRLEIPLASRFNDTPIELYFDGWTRTTMPLLEGHRYKVQGTIWPDTLGANKGQVICENRLFIKNAVPLDSTSLAYIPYGNSWVAIPSATPIASTHAHLNAASDIHDRKGFRDHYFSHLHKGVCEVISGSGRTLIKGRYSNGLRNGKWFEYYPNGTIMSISNYDKGLRRGKQTVFTPKGHRKTTMKIGRGKITVTDWYPCGAKSSVLDYYSQLRWEQSLYFESGQLASFTFAHLPKKCVYKEWWNNKKMKFKYINDKCLYSWDSTGTCLSSKVTHGSSTIVKSFYPTGDLQKSGKQLATYPYWKESLWYYWNRNQKIDSIVSYDRGIKNGAWSRAD